MVWGLGLLIRITHMLLQTNKDVAGLIKQTLCLSNIKRKPKPYAWNKSKFFFLQVIFSECLLCQIQEIQSGSLTVVKLLLCWWNVNNKTYSKINKTVAVDPTRKHTTLLITKILYWRSAFSKIDAALCVTQENSRATFQCFWRERRFLVTHSDPQLGCK